MAHTLTAQDIQAMGKGRLAVEAGDVRAFLTGRNRTRQMNIDLLNYFNRQKHSEDAIAEVGLHVFSVVRAKAALDRISEEAAQVFADIVLTQAGLASADVNGIVMNAVRPLITAVQEGRANTSQMVADLLNPDIVSDLNHQLEEKRKTKLGDAYPDALNAFMQGTAVPTVGEKHCCRLILADCLAPAAAMYLTNVLHDRKERMSCPEAREVLLRTAYGIRIQDAIDNGRSIKDIA